MYWVQSNNKTGVSLRFIEALQKLYKHSLDENRYDEIF